MTLTMAWERDTPTGSELVFASDSRLRQGGHWDVAPKIFRLPRTDALMAFAGETLWAYPIALQTISTIEANNSSRNRYYDLAAAKGLAIRSMNAMLKSGDAVATHRYEIDFEFLFGGWSWRDERFVLWRIYWSPSERQMLQEPIRKTRSGLVCFVGTRDRGGSDASSDVVRTAKSILSKKLRKKHGFIRRENQLDMEPWDVLIEMLDSGSFPTVGGSPQLAKIYRYMDTRTFAVRWPAGSDRISLLGRELLDEEKTDAPIVDAASPFG